MGETKFAWLIESKVTNGQPVWAKGWLTKNALEWTPDANEALHFADERSAKAMLTIVDDKTAIVTEHGFG